MFGSDPNGRESQEDSSLEARVSPSKKTKAPRLDVEFNHRLFGEEVRRKSLMGDSLEPDLIFHYTSSKANLLVKYGVKTLRLPGGDSVPTPNASPKRIGIVFQRYYKGYLQRRNYYGWPDANI